MEKKEFFKKLDKSTNFWFTIGILIGCFIMLIDIAFAYCFGFFDKYLNNDYTFNKDNTRQVAKAEEPLAVYNGTFSTRYINTNAPFYSNVGTNYMFLPFSLNGFNNISTSDITSSIVIDVKFYNPNNNLSNFFLSSSNWSTSFSNNYFNTNSVFYSNIFSLNVVGAYDFGSIVFYFTNSNDIFLCYLNISFSTDTDSYSFTIGSDTLFNYLSASYDSNYTNGYNAGYNEGNLDGIASGYQEGYQVGYNDGYNLGLEDGYADGETDGYALGYLDGYTDALDSTDYTESIDLNSYYNYKSFYTQQNPNYWVSIDSTDLVVNVGDIALNNPASYIALYFNFSNYVDGYSYAFNATFEFSQFVNNVALLTTDSYSSTKFNTIANFEYLDYGLNNDLDGLNDAINFDFSNIEFTPQGNQNYLVLVFYNQVIFYDEWFRINDFDLIGEFTFDSRLDKAFNDGIDYADSRVNYRSASYLDGLDLGYKNGYSDGMVNSGEYSFPNFFFGIIDAPVRAVLNLFNFEIFGYNMRTFLLAIFSICLVVVIVRLILRMRS